MSYATSKVESTTFRTLTDSVGKFELAGKKALIADLCGSGTQLLAATLRSFGIDAEVMETYKGLKLGKQFTVRQGVLSLPGHPRRLPSPHGAGPRNARRGLRSRELHLLHGRG